NNMTRFRYLGNWLCLTILVVAIGLVARQPPALSGDAPGKTKEGGLSAEQIKLNLDSFKQVWETVRDTHWDAKVGGLDWQAVHDEFKPKVEKAASQKEVRQLLNEMLGRLKQSHFGVIPSEVYQEVTGNGGKKTNQGVPGFDVRVLDGKAI